jgi:hypothetical protein
LGACDNVFNNKDKDSKDTPKKIHYISIDIDDIFLAAEGAKTNADDVEKLLELTNYIRKTFNSDFKFTVGYNPCYFDSLNSGDNSFLKNANNFLWFNHLPHHDLLVDKKLTSAQIDSLLDYGLKFERDKDIFPYTTTYIITPKHQGIWPVYEPLYTNLYNHGYKYTATPLVDSHEYHNGIVIFPRVEMRLSAAVRKIDKNTQVKVEILKNKILTSSLTIFYLHQANFTDERPGEKIIKDLCQSLLLEKDSKFVFLPSEKAIEAFLETK